MADKNLEMDITDALIEKPYSFIVEGEGGVSKRFYIFPTTLGKTYLLKRHLDNLAINYDILQKNPYLESLRLATEKKEEVCRIITYHTLKKKRDIFDPTIVNETTTFFMENMTGEELATILIYVLTKDKTEEFKKHLGITKEQERMRLVYESKMKAQKSQNDFYFGGKTIYGTLIDTACERYGWSYDYVMWGISFVNLQLLISDRTQNMYISDDEKKKISKRLLNDQNTINADDKDNIEKIMAMDWK